ncbi:hypothetical protein ACJMK2_002562 [Sinanodonta woodiana]|uniref:THAP-type domain-containing protein n=1 Tax=Sinanodonta woodiana TaxID=1069815 RepID=A0ABD3XXB1_SINWO
MPAHFCCVGFNSRQQQNDRRRSCLGFQRNDMLRSKWIAALRRENWLPTDYTRICSKHFIQDSGDSDFVPTIFSYTPGCKQNDYVLRPKSSGISVWLRRTMQKKTIAAEALLSPNTFEESNVSVQLIHFRKRKSVLFHDLAENLHELNEVPCKYVELLKKLKDANETNAIIMNSLQQNTILYRSSKQLHLFLRNVYSLLPRDTKQN